MVLTCPGGSATARLDVAQKNLGAAIITEGKIAEEATPLEKDYADARKKVADVRSRLARAKDHVNRCKNELCIAQSEVDTEEAAESRLQLAKKRLFSEKSTTKKRAQGSGIKSEMFSNDGNMRNEVAIKAERKTSDRDDLFGEDDEVTDEMLSKIDMQNIAQ